MRGIMEERKGKIIVISAFVGMLIIPAITFNSSREISLVENRNLTKLTNTIYMENHKIHGVSDAIRNFENWYSDHMGLRDYGVKLNAYLQYKMFGNISDRRFLIGKEGNWYYQDKERTMLRNYQKTWEISDDTLKMLAESFTKTKEHAEALGAHAIWMMCVDKETIYPEFFPENIHVVGSENAFDSLIAYMKANTDIDIFSVKDTLWENKNKGALLYNKKWDVSHWSHVGAYLGYVEAMKHIKNYLPDIEILTLEDVTFLPEMKQCELIYGAISEQEQVLTYQINEPDNMEMITDRPSFMPDDKQHVYYEFINHDKPEAPVLLIIGNSYIHSFLLPSFSQSFSKVIFSGNGRMDKVYELIEYSGADVVLFQTVERTGIQRIELSCLGLDI